MVLLLLIAESVGCLEWHQTGKKALTLLLQTNGI
jgi:hypothetical protein